MTIREASRQFHITEHEIETYEAKGFIEKSGDEYCDGDFRHLTTLRLLLNAGMGDGEIVRYLSLLDREGTQQAQLRSCALSEQNCWIDYTNGNRH